MWRATEIYFIYFFLLYNIIVSINITVAALISENATVCIEGRKVVSNVYFPQALGSKTQTALLEAEDVDVT